MKTIDITVNRMIPASAQAAFDTWIDPHSPGGLWYGVKKVILNPVVDGLFYHVNAFEGKDWAHYGRFVRVERPSVLEHTWVSEATKGTESLVTITLKPEGDSTLFMLRHSRLPDDEMGRRHQEGWTGLLGVLAERFALSHSG
jgi:uncharacterized protein YndB with AHSA1/START domain